MLKYYCSYPSVKLKKDNPFLGLLSKHLYDLDWEHKFIKFRTFSLILNRNKIKLLWFHWPSSIWRRGSLFLRIFKIFRFFYHIYLAKILGYKIVWSSHNVLPHESQFMSFELIIRKLFVKNVDLVIGHAKTVLTMLNEQNIYPNKYILAIHGHYEDVYNKKNIKISRTTLGFKRKDIVVFLKSSGKNYESAFNFITDSLLFDLKNIKLLVVGEKTVEHPNVKHVLGFVDDIDLSQYLSISNFVCIPYNQITTSGLYFLALTFNKPVIAKRIPFFEAHTKEGTSLLYENMRDLKVIFNLLQQNNFELDKEAINQLKQEYCWKSAAKIISLNFSSI